METTIASGVGILWALVIIIIVGGFVGWLAGLIVEGTGFGLVADVVIGILGSLIAGYLFPALGLTLGGGVVGGILAALVGAIILLVIVKLIRRVT